MGRPFKCPCGSTNSVAKGYRRTKTMGLRRVRLCKSCGKKFTPKKQKPVEAGAGMPAVPRHAEQTGAEPDQPPDTDDRHYQRSV